MRDELASGHPGSRLIGPSRSAPSPPFSMLYMAHDELGFWLVKDSQQSLCAASNEFLKLAWNPVIGAGLGNYSFGRQELPN